MLVRHDTSRKTLLLRRSRGRRRSLSVLPGKVIWKIYFGKCFRRSEFLARENDKFFHCTPYHTPFECKLTIFHGFAANYYIFLFSFQIVLLCALRRENLRSDCSQMNYDISHVMNDLIMAIPFPLSRPSAWRRSRSGEDVSSAMRNSSILLHFLFIGHRCATCRAKASPVRARRTTNSRRKCAENDIFLTAISPKPEADISRCKFSSERKKKISQRREPERWDQL